MPPKVNKVEADLKKLTKLDGNNICANCPEKMPGYAEMTHCIFICTKCAGVHREYQYKVKGISMSSFTDEDVQQLSRVGNEAHNAVYMARFTPREFQIPNGSDIVKLKEFIRMKYVDRRWYGDPTAIENNSRAFSSNFQPYAAAIDLAKYPIAPPKHPVEKVASRSSASLALPSQNAYQDPFSGLVYGQTTATPTYFDPFKSDPVPSAADSAFNPFGSNVAQPNSSQSSSNGSFDPFGDASAKAAGAFQAFNNGNYNNSNAGFIAFTSPHPNPSANPFNVVPTRQSYPVQHIGSSPFELFGSNVEHPTISQLSNNGLFNPFGDTSTKATGAFSAFDDLLEAETAANLTISGGLGEPSVLSRGLPAMDETITALKKILNSERERRKALESELEVFKNQNGELLSSLSSLPEQLSDLQDVNAQLETELDRMMGRKHAVDKMTLDECVFVQRNLRDSYDKLEVRKAVLIREKRSFQNEQPLQKDHQQLCVICQDKEKCVVLLPCKHLCLCLNCSTFDSLKECPLCRQTITDKMGVYS